MTLFNYMDEHEQIKNLHNRINNLKSIDKSHQKLNGELREEVQNKYAIDFERHIKELARLREAALKKGSFSSAVNAEVARGKAAGLYIEQKIIKTGKLEDLTERELEERMKQIIDEYSPILDAKPIEEIKAELKSLPNKKGKEQTSLEITASTQTEATSTEELHLETKEPQ